MPAVSRAQARFFGMLRGNPKLARSKGISQRVVDEYVARGGGTIKALPERAPKPPRMFGALSR